MTITAIHAAADWAKIRLAPRLPPPPIVPFLADQAVHLLILAAVVAIVESHSPGLAPGEAGTAWWIACVYLVATFALSIALPLWLNPPSLAQRPQAARLILVLASGLVLTLAWRGWPLLVPVAGLGLYQAAARRLGRNPATPTFPVEFWTAVTVAASLGWVLH